MSFGEGSLTEPETTERESWPTLRQFCVFLENRVGHLHELLRCVEKHDLRVIGISIVDSMDCAMARLVMDNTDRARELLELAGYTFSEIDIIGVSLPENDRPVTTICTPLLAAELNIHYTYALIYRKGGRGAIALYVDDVDLAMQTLRQRGLQIITESDLADDDEYF